MNHTPIMPPLPPPTATFAQARLRFTLLTALFTAFGLPGVVALGTGCGAVEDTEMFRETSQALSENVGQSCESYPVTNLTEVNVEDHDTSCEPAFCVTKGGQPGASEGQGICSCRCDGPSGTGPFCGCGEGFVCEHLVDGIPGLDLSSLAGSYCMPR